MALGAPTLAGLAATIAKRNGGPKNYRRDPNRAPILLANSYGRARTPWLATVLNYYGDQGSETTHCQVRLDGAGLDLMSSAGELLWQGVEQAPGHFRLTKVGDNGSIASLHRFPGGKTFDGWWLEDGYEGMWRITLSD